MLGGVWLIYFGFGLLSLAMAPLVDPISRDLGLSYTTMGAILGAWPLVYIVGPPRLAAPSSTVWGSSGRCSSPL